MLAPLLGTQHLSREAQSDLDQEDCLLITNTFPAFRSNVAFLTFFYKNGRKEEKGSVKRQSEWEPTEPAPEI
jgi:hypothetical protein